MAPAAYEGEASDWPRGPADRHGRQRFRGHRDRRAHQPRRHLLRL